MISVAMAGVTLGSILFAFGGRLATIETKATGVEVVAIEAKTKSETALTQTAELKGKVDAIYLGLVRSGLIQEK